jgi:hypothetical protein
MILSAIAQLPIKISRMVSIDKKELRIGDAKPSI